MAIKLSDLYLYLTRRDKSGVRILAKFKGRPQLATRIDDLEPLQLPTGWQSQLSQIIYDSRMLWEPWIESADSYDELKSDLKIRNYINIPVNAQPEFVSSVTQTPIINVSYLPRKTTMMRKGN